MSQEPLTLSVADAAARLGVSRATINVLVRDGRLPAIPISRPGAKRAHVRIPRVALEKLAGIEVRL